MNVMNLVISGLSLGAVYAMVALGIVILFKASEVLNFAHGSLVLLGAYITARTYPLFGFVGAVIAGIITSVLAAVVIERLLIRSMRDAPVVSLAIMTIGLEVILNTELTRQIGTAILPVGAPWGNQTIDILGAHVPLNRIIAIVVVVLIIAAFLLAFRFSAWGVAMRAAAEDRETAELLGLRLGRITLLAWAIAGALAAIAGVFLAGAPSPGVAPGLALIAMRAFPAAIIGGLDSVAGALVGGLAIGMVEALAVGFQDQLAFLGRGVVEVFPYALMILVLIWRPQGLFGRKEALRA